MPQLLFKNQFYGDNALNPTCYFKDARWIAGYHSYWKFDIKETYPYEIYMHLDTDDKKLPMKS